MKYLLSSCFLILFHFVSIGQYFTIDTVKGMSPHAYHNKYIFPDLKCKSNQMAAERINQDLRQDILELDSGKQYKSIFEKVWGSEENPMPMESDFSFEVVNNDDRFFCITMSAEGCGAYCEDWTRYYTWDSRTGQKIELQELFSSTGLQRFSDSLRTLRNHRIRSAVADLKKTMKKDLTASPEDAEGIQMAIGIFFDCLDTARTPAVSFGYTLDHEHLDVYLGACLPHMIRAYDEVDYTFIFDLNKWDIYLSDYAKSLLKQ
jgi:hypothetical protein